MHRGQPKAPSATSDPCSDVSAPFTQCGQRALQDFAGTARSSGILRWARTCSAPRVSMQIVASVSLAAAAFLGIASPAAAQSPDADKEAADKAKAEAEKQKTPEELEVERRAAIDARRLELERRNTGRDPRTGAPVKVVPPNAASESKKFAPPAPTAGKPTPPAAAAAAGVQPTPPVPQPVKGAPGAPATAQAQPTAGTAAVPLTPGGLSGDYFTFSSFSEPIDLAELVDFVQSELKLQIIKTDAGLRGQTVVMSTPVTLHKDDVLRFLVMLLELRDYTMVQDRSGVYIIQDKSKPISGIARGELSPTRIIPTPGIRPSTLTAVITGLVTNARGATGAPAPQNSISFLDDLGVIVINEAPRVTRVVEDFVAQVVRDRAEVKFHRIPVVNIAASSAKDRILEMLGVASRFSGGVPNQPQGQPQPQAIGSAFSGSLTNLSERLVVDQGSNSLFFRGRDDEKDQVGELLTLVDVISTLVTKWYPVGNATTDAVAAEGRRLQLGDSITFQPNEGSAGAGGTNRAAVPNPNIQNLAGGAGGSQEIAGSGFILYPDSGGFVYRGTPEQHNRVNWLIDQLKELSKSEEVVYEFYKLKHGKSEEIATTLQDLISSTQSASSSPLLGSNLGTNSRNNSRDRNSRNRTAQNTPQPSNTGGIGGEGSVGDIDGEAVFVIADEPNNQVVVKAPLKLQPQIRRLIEKLDLRRPQVYIEAMIVAVSDSENFRLAVEAQGIIGQWAFNTNFGLGSLTTTTGSGSSETTTGGITSRKNVETDLAGLTTAIVRSKDVPLVINALQNNTNARIVAKPQLLVDDNVEAEVQSRDQQPTTESNQGTSTTTTSFSGYEDAGPRLRVTPQISEGGYMKLEYEIEISSFQGDPQSPGVPPAKQTNTISSESVTVPSDSTIVVGGLTQEAVNDIVIKVPLLGDIPIIGVLFRDTRKNTRNITFFVFITPRIMRDPSFADLRLLTRGPLQTVNAEDLWPQAEAEKAELLDPRWNRPESSTELESPATGGTPGSVVRRGTTMSPAEFPPTSRGTSASPAPAQAGTPVLPADMPPPTAEESTFEDGSIKVEDAPPTAPAASGSTNP